MRKIFIRTVFGRVFDGLEEHANKVKECGWAFQQAVECHTSHQCKRFEEYWNEVDRLESEADSLKRKIRSSIPKNKKLPVEAFLLFMYIKEQDKVLDSVNTTLNWLSYRPESSLDEEMKKGLFDLVSSVIAPIEELSIMVSEARKYFENYSSRQRTIVKGIIHNLRRYEHEADHLEEVLKMNLFAKEKDPVALFYMIRLADLIGSVADHAENAADMMRAMIAK